MSGQKVCPTCEGRKTVHPINGGCTNPLHACVTCRGSGKAPTEGEKPANYRLPCGHYGGRCTIEGGCVRPDPQLEADEELRRSRGGDRMVCANCGFKHDGVGQSAEHPILGELGQPEADRYGYADDLSEPEPKSPADKSGAGAARLVSDAILPAQTEPKPAEAPRTYMCDRLVTCDFYSRTPEKLARHIAKYHPEPKSVEKAKPQHEVYQTVGVTDILFQPQPKPAGAVDALAQDRAQVGVQDPTDAQSQPIEGKELDDILDQFADRVSQKHGYRTGEPSGCDIAKAQLTKYVQDQLIAELEEMYKCSPSQETYEWVNERIAQLRKERDQ